MKSKTSIGTASMLCLGSMGKRSTKRKMRIVVLMGILLIFSISLSAITMRVSAQAPPYYDVTVVVPQLYIKDCEEAFPEDNGPDVYCYIKIVGLEGGETWESSYTEVEVGSWTRSYRHGFGSVPAYYSVDYGQYLYTVYVKLWDDDTWPGADDLLSSGSALVFADPSLNPQTLYIAETQFTTSGIVNVWITQPVYYDVTVVVPQLLIKASSEAAPEDNGPDVYCSIRLIGMERDDEWESSITEVEVGGMTPWYQRRFGNMPAFYDVGNMKNRYLLYVEIWDEDFWVLEDDLLAWGSTIVDADPSLNPQTFNIGETEFVTGGAVYVWLAGPTYVLAITTTAGGTTDPAPGSYTYYSSGTVVPVTAIVTNTDYYFSYWELDGNNVGAANPISVTMNQDHNVKAVFGGGGGVPEFPLGGTIEIALMLGIIFMWLQKKRKDSRIAVP